MDHMTFWALLPSPGEKMQSLVATENWGIDVTNIRDKACAPGQHIAIVSGVQNLAKSKTSYHVTILNDAKKELGAMDISMDAAVADFFAPVSALLEAFNEPDESEFDAECTDGEIVGLD